MNGAATGLRIAGIVLNLKLLVNSASTGGFGPLMIVRPSSTTPDDTSMASQPEDSSSRAISTASSVRMPPGLLS